MAYAMLALALIIENALEFVFSIVAVTNPLEINFYMDLVIAALALVFIAVLNFAVAVSQIKFGKVILNVFVAWAALVLFVHANGWLITGYQLTSYSIISSPGPLSILWLTYAFFTCAAAPILLLLGLNGPRPKESWSAFKGIIWISGTVVGTAALRLAGIEASTGALLSISAGICMLVLLNEKEQYFISFETSPTLQIKRALLKWKVLYRLSRTSKLDLQNWNRIMQKTMIEDAMKHSDNNFNKAASFIGIPESTLRDRYNKYASQEEEQNIKIPS